jgi:hypothetical protein
MSSKSISRRQFVKVTAAGAAFAAIPNLVQSMPSVLTWHNVRDWGVEGRGWPETLRDYDRLPGKAETTVPEAVWNLSRHSAGMSTRFVSDAETIWVRYSLLSDRLAMPHMPATGVSGLDLYSEDADGIDRWVSVVKPTEQTMEVAIAKDLRPGRRRYTLYLPLYNGVESLEIGIDSSALFEPVAPRTERPILFYGTSIVHGACASRPGMAFTSILERRLNRPVINLGFSGSGKMEPEVGALLAEIDPCVYVIDCLPNMNAAMITERAAPLVRQLRTAHPDTPILLVEDRTFANAPFFPARHSHHRDSRAAFKAAYQELRDSGVEGLRYHYGDGLIGFDAEGTTDGSHPNDLGMFRYADAYEPILQGILR